MSDIVIVSRDVGRRAENLIVAGGSGTVLKGVELLLQENVYVLGHECKPGPNQIDCSVLLKKGLNTLQSMPFELLGLELNSGTVDVRKAYKKLALKYHPDKNPKTTPLFQLIQNIQARLTDSTERSKEILHAQHNRPSVGKRESPYGFYGNPMKQEESKPTAPPPKPNPSAYQQYQQHYQQYQQRQQQQQQQQPQQQQQREYHYGAAGSSDYRPAGPNMAGAAGKGGPAGFSHYDQYASNNNPAEDYRRKNYYEDLLREQYRKAAEAEKRAREYANKFQHNDDIFQEYAPSKPTRPSYPPSDNSTTSANSKNEPQFNSFKPNNQKPAVPNQPPPQQQQQPQSNAQQQSNKQPQQQQQNQSKYPSDSSSTSQQTNGSDKYSTGQTYRTTSDGRVYPQQQYYPTKETSSTTSKDTFPSNVSSKNNTSSTNAQSSAQAAESAKYNYSYNPANANRGLSGKEKEPASMPTGLNPSVNGNGNGSGKTVMIPRPFAFKAVNKTSTIVELEWKTSALHNCPLVVELSWKDHSKANNNNKIWEMSSKLIRSGVCRKKNLSPGVTYEFRVRSVEEYADGKIGNKSEWTDAIVVTLPLTDNKPADGVNGVTPTPDNVAYIQKTKQQPPAENNYNTANARSKVPVSASPKPTNNNEKSKPGKDDGEDTSSRSVNSNADSNNINNDKSPNGGGNLRFKRFPSKFGVQETTVEPTSQQPRYMQAEPSPTKATTKKETSTNPPSSKTTTKQTEKDTADNFPSRKENFLSASARLAWGKETLGKENPSATSSRTHSHNNLDLEEEDVTYLEVEEELDEEEDEKTGQRPRQKLQKNPSSKQRSDSADDNDSAAEIEEEETLRKAKKEGNNKNNNQNEQYQDDFEMSEEEIPPQHPTKTTEPPLKATSIDADEVEDEYTDSDGSSIKNHTRRKETVTLAKDGKPPKPHNHHHHHRERAITPPEISTSQNSAYGSESENNLELEEEKIFLLYPPKDQDNNNSTSNTTSPTSSDHTTTSSATSKRIYRHPVHKEPFLRSDVKGYLFVDQNVIACANCGDWLRVKVHVVAKHRAPSSSSSSANDEWGWCLRKDKMHVYLRLLEGRSKMTVLEEKSTAGASNRKTNNSTSASSGNSNSTTGNGRNTHSAKQETNNPSPASSEKENANTKSSGISSGDRRNSKTKAETTTNSSGIAGITGSFHSPPLDNKGINRNSSAAALLNKSLRNIPKPAFIHGHQKHEKKNNKDSKQSGGRGGGGGGGGGVEKMDSSRSEDPTPIEQWIECFDEHGNVYYFNEATNESKWEPPEWFEEEDPTTGAKYYIHFIMKDEENIEFHSTWTKPKQFSKLIRQPG